MFNLSARENPVIGITMAAFCATAKAISAPIPAIRAVDEIESAGSGFLMSSKRPKMLFEGHYFYRGLKALGLAEKARAIDPTICYPSWTKEFYVGREGEYARLAKATEICRQLGVSDSIALRAASWGRYQIMGENFKLCGYDSVEAFVEAMFDDEGLHLLAFGNYVESTGLVKYLRAMPTTDVLTCAVAFANGYNGHAYAKNDYHHKIANAYRKFDGIRIDCTEYADVHVVDHMPGERNTEPDPNSTDNTSLDTRYPIRLLVLGMKGEDVRDAQRRLITYGYLAPDTDDGKFGTLTKTALIGFQKNNGLTADGKLGDNTRQRLFN